MSRHSEICPVCRGSGKYKETWNYGTTTGASYETVCHGCNGKGWVVVDDQTYYYGKVTYNAENFNMQEAIEQHVTNMY